VILTLTSSLHKCIPLELKVEMILQLLLESNGANTKNSKAVIIPSIVTGSYYAACEAEFKKYGVDIQGYIQWSQTITASGGGTNPPTSGSSQPTTGGNSGCPAGQCKSKWGYCGNGPDYCGEGCQGGPCNGAPKAAPIAAPKAAPKAAPVSNGCPEAGMCKSKWGYCGYGPAYCNNQRIDEEESTEENGGMSSGILGAVIVCSIIGGLFVIGLLVFVGKQIMANQEESSSERF